MIENSVDVDGYRFVFEGAIRAFAFDRYHNEPMKSVDIIVELEDAYVFVEVKEYDVLDDFDIRLSGTEEEQKKRLDCFRWLKGYLKYKYRDSYLFRSAEGKVEKPIHYVCLINFDTPLNQQLRKQLLPELPPGRANGKWTNEIVKSCQVVNEAKWKVNFPKWSLERITI